MADNKSTDTPDSDGQAELKPGSKPSSAPELSQERQQEIEAQLSVENQPAKLIELRSKLNDPNESEADVPPVVTETRAEHPADGKFSRFFAGYWHRKRWTIPLTLLLIVGVLAAVPTTRFALAGYAVARQVTVVVYDESTKKPVTSADVTLDNVTYKTDKDGKATFPAAKPGNHTLKAGKKYYKDNTASLDVPITKDIEWKLSIVAIGRQVPVSVINKITGKPLADVTLKASGTDVKTDKDGKAVIVLPADKPDLPITLSNGGYNGMEARVQVTDAAVKENTFSLVPSGKVYFLSRQSGKIDLVKTDLDGANRQVVVQGTGKEDGNNTVLLASRDWKFLALHSKRDSGLAKLYLIDTSTDKMSELDSGDAGFQLVGWSGHDFVYVANRNNIKRWQPNASAIKSFNADKRQILTIDQTAGDNNEANAYHQIFSTPYLVDGKVVYAVGWDFYGDYSQRNLGGRNNSLRISSLGSVSKKDIRNWPADQYSGYFSVIPYKPHELYLSTYSLQASKQVYYEYENGEVKDSNISDADYSSAYATYLESPDGKRTFWSESRDGKSAFFIGDAEGDNGKQLGTFDEYQVYGWYGDDYLLTSKKGSELYIMPAVGGPQTKIADYHKPQQSYKGYGGGYGGL